MSYSGHGRGFPHGSRAGRTGPREGLRLGESGAAGQFLWGEPPQGLNLTPWEAYVKRIYVGRGAVEVTHGRSLPDTGQPRLFSLRVAPRGTGPAAAAEVAVRDSETPLPGDSAPATRTHLGVIDVGSNAIRLQVARVFADGTFSVIHDEREPVRLGEEVFRTGVLSQGAVQRALATLVRYARLAETQGAARTRAVATSAVREAANGGHFTREVALATGLELEIITGECEAQLIARGVLSCVEALETRVALVDVGGGSTEVSLVERGRVLYSGSMPVGSVRLTELCCRTDPLSTEDERRLRQSVRDALRANPGLANTEPCPVVLGSAGTIGALANFIRRRPSAPRTSALPRTHFSMRELSRASAALRKMSLARRRRAPGIEERRAEIIVAGSVILEEVCAHLGARIVRAVRRGLRDGLMLEEIERLGLSAGGQPGEARTPIERRPPRRRRPRETA